MSTSHPDLEQLIPSDLPDGRELFSGGSAPVLPGAPETKP